jgi:hypothetical protein
LTNQNKRKKQFFYGEIWEIGGGVSVKGKHKSFNYFGKRTILFKKNIGGLKK